MKKILVTTDGSKNGEKALLEAKSLAEALGADIDILNVVKDAAINPYAVVNSYNMQTAKDLEEAGEEVLEESLKLFEGFKGEVNTKIRTGDPGDEIIKEAENGKYDLVVMGSRGLGTFSRAMLGSVSNKVLNHAKTNNILIVK